MATLNPTVQMPLKLARLPFRHLGIDESDSLQSDLTSVKPTITEDESPFESVDQSEGHSGNMSNSGQKKSLRAGKKEHHKAHHKMSDQLTILIDIWNDLPDQIRLSIVEIAKASVKPLEKEE